MHLYIMLIFLLVWGLIAVQWGPLITENGNEHTNIQQMSKNDSLCDCSVLVLSSSLFLSSCTLENNIHF